MFKNVIRNWFLSSVLHLTRLALLAVVDVLESKDAVSNRDVKLMLKQELFLESSNYQLSVLRKKVLAAINKAKVNLSDLPLPDAKKFYLGMTFPPSPQDKLTCHVAFLTSSH